MSNGTTPGTRRRLLLLCACLVGGCAIGVVGQYFAGSSAWFLAVPALVLVAWFFVADPTRCLPSDERPPREGRGR